MRKGGLKMTENKLTTEQIQKLINRVTKEPLFAYHALKDGPRYTDEQQEELVKSIAKDSQIASWALINIQWLTSAQKGQLKMVEAA